MSPSVFEAVTELDSQTRNSQYRGFKEETCIIYSVGVKTLHIIGCNREEHSSIPCSVQMMLWCLLCG